MSQRIEEKLNLTDDAWVEIQQVKNDPGDTVEGLVEDRELLADLDRNSELKTKLFAENIKSRVQWDFLSLALRGRKIGFEQVLKTIEDIIAKLKQNQFSEESNKKHCEKELEVSDDNKKVLEAVVFDPNIAHEVTSGPFVTAEHRPVSNYSKGFKSDPVETATSGLLKASVQLLPLVEEI